MGVWGEKEEGKGVERATATCIRLDNNDNGRDFYTNTGGSGTERGRYIWKFVIFSESLNYSKRVIKCNKINGINK